MNNLTEILIGSAQSLKELAELIKDDLSKKQRLEVAKLIGKSADNLIKLARKCA